MHPRYILAVITACTIATVSPTGAGTISSTPPDVTRLVVYAPLPEYPDILKRVKKARRPPIGGSTGLFVLRVNIKSGEVTQVLVGQSTGASLLDEAAVKALRTWRFKPGALPYRKITSNRMSPPQTEGETCVRVPVTF